MVVTLNEMKPGQSGVVKEIQGGLRTSEKLQAMGIRVGKRIKKKAAHFWRGPQTVAVDNFEAAVGHGMASKILVEVEDEKV
jgi:ferrous iron transport protein A